MPNDEPTSFASPPPEPDRANVLDETALQVGTKTNPRLSILHLLVWTATSGAMMALYTLITQRYPEPIRKAVAESMKSPVGMTMLTISVMAMGAEVGGVLMFVTRRWRRMAFPVQPGEWLLVTLGFAGVLSLIVHLALTLFGDQTLQNFSATNRIGHGVGQLLSTIAFAILAIWCRSSRSWTLFCWTATLIALLATVQTLSGIVMDRFQANWLLYWFPLGVGGLSLSVAVWRDFRRHIVRGWVHWVGICALLMTYGNSLIASIAWLLS